MVTGDAGGDRPTAVVVCVHIIIDSSTGSPSLISRTVFVNLTFLLFLDEK